MLKDFLDKKEKGELLIQKTHNLRNTILNKVQYIYIYMLLLEFKLERNGHTVL